MNRLPIYVKPLCPINYRLKGDICELQPYTVENFDAPKKPSNICPVQSETVDPVTNKCWGGYQSYSNVLKGVPSATCDYGAGWTLVNAGIASTCRYDGVNTAYRGVVNRSSSCSGDNHVCKNNPGSCCKKNGFVAIGKIPTVVESCPSGQQKYGGSCYNSCPSGYSMTIAGQCHNNNEPPIGTSRWYSRVYCPDNQVIYNGSCYNKCKDGFSVPADHAGECTNGKPMGLVDSIISCDQGWTYDSTTSLCYKKPQALVDSYNDWLVQTGIGGIWDLITNQSALQTIALNKLASLNKCFESIIYNYRHLSADIQNVHNTFNSTLTYTGSAILTGNFDALKNFLTQLRSILVAIGIVQNDLATTLNSCFKIKSAGFYIAANISFGLGVSGTFGVIIDLDFNFLDIEKMSSTTEYKNYINQKVKFFVCDSGSLGIQAGAAFSKGMVFSPYSAANYAGSTLGIGISGTMSGLGGSVSVDFPVSFGQTKSIGEFFGVADGIKPCFSVAYEAGAEFSLAANIAITEIFNV